MPGSGNRRVFRKQVQTALDEGDEVLGAAARRQVAVANELLIEPGRAYLVPGENVRLALGRFEDSRTEALPVLVSHSDRRVVGYLTEAYALRRYMQELERRRSAELGEQNLFSLGQRPMR